MLDGLVDHVAIAGLVATAVMLLLEWFPGLATWWAKFSEAQKKGIMAAIVAIISVAVVGINCGRGGTCPADWWGFIAQVVVVIILGGGAQQGMFRLVKRPNR